jgi:P2 family phage contractile tail tube protein
MDGVGTQTNTYKVYDSENSVELVGSVNVELPSMELIVNSFKGAGMGGEINVPAVGILGPQTATFAYPTIYGAITEYMEIGTTKTIDLREEIIVIDKDTLSPVRVPIRWVLKGPLSQANPGSIEPAAAGEVSILMQVYYMHLWIDGEEKLEWDPFKGIFTVNGKDLMADTRRNVFVG